MSTFRRDIANVLRATACASEGSAVMALELLDEADFPDGLDREKILQVYRQGVHHTLIAFGLAFGLELVGPSAQRKPEVTPGLAGLLWAESPYDR